MYILVYSNIFIFFFFFSSRRRHTRLQGDWSSDVCSSDLGAKGRSRQRFLTRDPHLAERRERESNSLEDGRVDPADRLEGEDHPLTTPSGTNRATIFVSPAPSATRTTSSTFLYAPGASSTIPAREAARR